MEEQLTKHPRLPARRGEIVQSVGQVHLSSCEHRGERWPGRLGTCVDSFGWGIKCMNRGYHLIQTSEISSFLLAKMCPAGDHYFKPSES